MSNSESYAGKIIADADALLAKVQRDLEDGAEFFRTNNINPDKLIPALDGYLCDHDKQALQKALQSDEADIQREVDEGLARLRFAAPPSAGSPKRPRTLV